MPYFPFESCPSMLIVIGKIGITHFLKIHLVVISIPVADAFMGELLVAWAPIHCECAQECSVGRGKTRYAGPMWCGA